MRKVIVLGGYGLIGSACMRALADAGFAVTGIGRSRQAALAAFPDANWLIRDIPAITSDEWSALLADADVVVNASGALQDGANDDLQAIHVAAVSNLVNAAAELPLRIIQISAAGVSDDASTAFFITKAKGDAIIASRAANWVILRPTLVLSHEAYGGTALLRAAAALPMIAPRIMPDAMVQTVYVGDVANAVVAAARGDVPSGTIADLTEAQSRSFPDLVAAIRRWQGWPAPALSVRVPGLLLKAIGRLADLLGHLGWRAPLRTTALSALSEGIQGDPATWDDLGARPCRSLTETLQLIPATHQERLFARAYLALPLAIATLALFWCLSGLVTLADPGAAMAVLNDRAVPTWFSAPVVIGGAIADLGLGLAILRRKWTRTAALGMLSLSAAYLFGSVIAAPDLWADPLGPMVKVFLAMALAAMVWLLMDDR